MNRLFFSAATVLLFFSVSGTPNSVLAQEKEKITVATITLSLNNLPLYVAQEKGYFAKQNLFYDKYIDDSFLEEARRLLQ